MYDLDATSIESDVMETAVRGEMVSEASGGRVARVALMVTVTDAALVAAGGVSGRMSGVGELLCKLSGVRNESEMRSGRIEARNATCCSRRGRPRMLASGVALSGVSSSPESEGAFCCTMHAKSLDRDLRVERYITLRLVWTSCA